MTTVVLPNGGRPADDETEMIGEDDDHLYTVTREGDTVWIDRASHSS
jgi:hypothetical protein